MRFKFWQVLLFCSISFLLHGNQPLYSVDSDKAVVKNSTIKTTAVCSGKYKKSQNLGFEIINVRCPRLTDTCACEIDKKFNNQVRCGSSVKKSSFEANLVDCESRFILEER